MYDVVMILTILLVPISAVLFWTWATAVSEPPFEEVETIIDSAKASVRRGADRDFTNGRIWLAETGLYFASQRLRIGTPRLEWALAFDEILACEVGQHEEWSLFQSPLRIETSDQTWRIYFADFANAWTHRRIKKWQHEVTKRLPIRS